MSSEITDPEFGRELLGMNEAASFNEAETREILKRHPDLPEDVVRYMCLSAETITKMAQVMGRMGERLITATEILERRFD